jgi:hypothetical protein
MTIFQPEGPNPVACPLLGLVTDRQSHYMYAHSAHRCFASDRPASTDASRQMTFCLSGHYVACDRFEARQRRAQKR